MIGSYAARQETAVTVRLPRSGSGCDGRRVGGPPAAVTRRSRGAAPPPATACRSEARGGAGLFGGPHYNPTRPGYFRKLWRGQ